MTPWAPPGSEVIDPLFPHLGELARKAALGLVALLFVTRAYYPSEDAPTGTGLVWVLLLLGVAGLAVAANLLAGVTRFRWSWADPIVFSLFLLVSLSAGHAADRRPAISMAWEWGGLGLLYFLVRNLPATRGESVALARVVVATAVAVAAYGLYQAPVEFEQLREMYRRNPSAMLGRLGIPPGSPSAAAFEQRLVFSNEPFSTFALANSLAGFLVGPLVLLLATILENLKRDGRASRGWCFILAGVPGLTLLVCLLLTKSRSAYVGLALALALLAWSYRRTIPRRWLVGAGIGLLVAVVGLVAAGVATRQLDVQILTQAKKSLGYRWEYWLGSWGVITDAPAPFAPSSGSNVLMTGGSIEPDSRSSRPFWWGVGPANFAGPYLKHKLPSASEEIQDPHNLILQVWAEAGVFAMLALVGSLVVGIALILAPVRPDLLAEEEFDPASKAKNQSSNTWIITMGGLGWFGVWILGELNPINQSDMTIRWLILGAAWLMAVLLLGPLWARQPLPALGLGAATLALTVNLLAAGGIGIPSVAMVLWVSLALGLNLRDDRPCGRLRESHGLALGIALACGWAVLAGTFFGAVGPAWRSDAALANGEAAMRVRPPQYEAARNSFADAIELDHYSIQPWLALADLEYSFWKSPESANGKNKTGWTKVLLTLDKALEGVYRNPDSLALRRRQANYARVILKEIPEDAKPFELLSLKSTIAKATRQAVRLYPTSAPLRAELAEASADLGLYADAAAEARVALQLDTLTPHLDKKLPGNLVLVLRSRIEQWDELAKAPAPSPRQK